MSELPTPSGVPQLRPPPTDGTHHASGLHVNTATLEEKQEQPINMFRIMISPESEKVSDMGHTSGNAPESSISLRDIPAELRQEIYKAYFEIGRPDGPNSFPTSEDPFVAALRPCDVLYKEILHSAYQHLYVEVDVRQPLQRFFSFRLDAVSLLTNVDLQFMLFDSSRRLCEFDALGRLLPPHEATDANIDPALDLLSHSTRLRILSVYFDCFSYGTTSIKVYLKRILEQNTRKLREFHLRMGTWLSYAIDPTKREAEGLLNSMDHVEAGGRWVEVQREMGWPWKEDQWTAEFHWVLDSAAHPISRYYARHHDYGKENGKPTIAEWGFIIFSRSHGLSCGLYQTPSSPSNISFDDQQFYHHISPFLPPLPHYFLFSPGLLLVIKRQAQNNMGGWRFIPFWKKRKPKYRLLAYNKHRTARLFRLPEPLGARKRSLTIPLLDGSHNHQRTIKQRDSRLLTTLPLEIREIIWHHSLGNMQIAVYFKDGHLIRNPGGPEPLPAPKLRQGLLSLLLACRQSYSETVNLLYSANAFYLNVPQHLPYLSEILLPQRVAQISDIKLGWFLINPPELESHGFQEWVEACQYLASLPGLQNLRVEIEGDSPWILHEAELLRPLALIKQTKIFQLVLHWLPGNKKLPEMDCEIIRVPRGRHFSPE
ncbi:hypothetical protein HYFRA_00001541 [Hymenoscyphus fraxineus]|uniref:DUF7730 domain-containing protein n=1 Tax=Hymenoscyphus fraxineus TaxID=746836 RepID=A0A9N9L7V6_9HELO|nr:hypothetical protein HYFRA_00001541 [Hymenoscyphus fraxineus]